MTFTSIVSYFASAQVTPERNFFVDQIVTHTIEYIAMSWFITPYYQTHKWVKYDSSMREGDVEEGRNGNNNSSSRSKGICRKWREGRMVYNSPDDNEHPKELNTRYYPFSLYNDLFMAMNKGYMLNHDINESLDYFPSDTGLFIKSVLFRGLLNFFLFLNVLYQLRFVARNEQSTWGLIFTANSLLFATFNLRAYFWCLVFFVFFIPYMFYLFFIRCGIHLRQGSIKKHPDGRRKIVKGSYMYNVLLFVWKRVNY